MRPKHAEAWVGEGVVERVRAAGGVPLLVPPGPAPLEVLLGLADGVVITGGHFDIHPGLYGEEVVGRLDRIETGRTTLELALARACLDRGLPVLGLCGGHQALAVAAGGTLIQDIATQLPDAREHEQPTDPATPWHTVHVTGPARAWLGEHIEANSTHHQAVRDPGRLTVCGTTDDGVVEIIAADGPAFALGVQWHPELLGQSAPFDALLAATRR